MKSLSICLVSSVAFALLPVVVEKRSGKPYSVFLQEEIFNPLGIEQTSTYYPEVEIKNRAFGHLVENGEAIPQDQRLTSALQGDGSIYTSVKDYVIWD